MRELQAQTGTDCDLWHDVRGLECLTYYWAQLRREEGRSE
jgi:hypothetical protein